MVTCDIVIGLAVRILDYAKQPKTALALAHFLWSLTLEAIVHRPGASTRRHNSHPRHSRTLHNWTTPAISCHNTPKCKQYDVVGRRSDSRVAPCCPAKPCNLFSVRESDSFKYLPWVTQVDSSTWVHLAYNSWFEAATSHHVTIFRGIFVFYSQWGNGWDDRVFGVHVFNFQCSSWALIPLHSGRS